MELTNGLAYGLSERATSMFVLLKVMQGYTRLRIEQLTAEINSLRGRAGRG